MKLSIKCLLLSMGLLLGGCAVYYPVSVDNPNGTDEVSTPAVTTVSAYSYLPSAVIDLIYNKVDGYNEPAISRYGYDLYPTDVVKDDHNLPSYIKSDFNGDGKNDYAMMFSKVEWDNGYWYLTTRLEVAVSSDNGDYELAVDLKLGTVSGPVSEPVQEYWAIRLLGAGTHTVTTVYDGSQVEESFHLDNSGIYLTSLDPEERSVMYVAGTDAYEFSWDLGALAKSKAAVAVQDRGERTILLGSEKDGPILDRIIK